MYKLNKNSKEKLEDTASWTFQTKHYCDENNYFETEPMNTF